MNQRINTKNPDGTYKRVDTNIAFNPEQVSIMAQRILNKYNIFNVPVKILNNISEINYEEEDPTPTPTPSSTLPLDIITDTKI
jgi:hypothetical protein